MERDEAYNGPSKSSRSVARQGLNCKASAAFYIGGLYTWDMTDWKRWMAFACSCHLGITFRLNIVGSLNVQRSYKANMYDIDRNVLLGVLQLCILLLQTYMHIIRTYIHTYIHT